MKILITISILALITLSLGTNDLIAATYTSLSAPDETCCMPTSFTIQTAITAPVTSSTLSMTNVVWPTPNGCSGLSYTPSTTLSLSSSDSGATYTGSSPLAALTATYSNGFLSWAYSTGCTGPYIFVPNYLAAGTYTTLAAPGANCCLPLKFTIGPSAFNPKSTFYSVSLTSPKWSSASSTLIAACNTLGYTPNSSTKILLSSVNGGSSYTVPGITGLTITYASGNLSAVYATGCTTPCTYVRINYSNMIGLGLTIFAFFILCFLT